MSWLPHRVTQNLLLLLLPLSLVGQKYELWTLDSTAQLSPQEIAQIEFVEKGGKDLSYAGGEGYVYAKITPQKIEGDADYLMINYSTLDSISFYGRLRANGQLEVVKHTGQSIPFSQREFNTSDFVLELDKKYDTYFLRIKNADPIVLPFKYEDKKTRVFRNLSNNDLIFGAFAGIILVMFLYNLVLYFITRDASYIFYTIYLLALGLTQASIFGYVDRFILTESPDLARKMLNLSGALVGMSTAAFIIKFLHLKEKNGTFYRIFIGMVVIDAIAFVISLFGFEALTFNIINLVAMVGSAVAIAVGVVLVNQGFRPARFFLIAWTIFLTSVIVYSISNFGFLEQNIWTRRSMLIGSTLEIILLSVALADRINVLRKEKEASQEEALKMAKENERIIREQNVELEKRVDARTMELQEANEELQVAMQSLKDTQTQLVDAEKMASLGQLTAGIAHEINNPINFITSNIKPLRMDLDEIQTIVDGLKQMPEEPSQAQVSEVKQLLEEYDYDFLREEIGELVDGISDGAQRTSEIVRGLRTFSRLDEDVVKPADINEGLDSTMVLLRNKTKDSIQVVRDYAEDIPDVECFPGKLNQAFMNILNNGIYAVKHKEHPEGERPTLTLKTRMKSANEVNIHLIDNGIGMSEDTQKKMFDPFFTTKEVGEGTGLGMSIVFKIVDKHNGTLQVNSREGEGSEFIITLPIKQPSEFS